MRGVRLLRPVLAIVLVTGSACTPVADQTPGTPSEPPTSRPTFPAATAAPAIPDATATPPATVAPPGSADPTTTSTPPSLEPPDAPTTPDPDARPPDAGDWRYIDNFPALATLEMADVIATDDGFVAVGTDFSGADATVGDWMQGAIWTSRDGVNWEHRADSTFASAKLQHIVEWNGELYVFGTAGFCVPHAGCDPVPANAGTNIWRSSISGGWEALPQSDVLRWGFVEDVTVAGDRLLAVGGQTDEAGGPSRDAAVWHSDDGVTWLAAEAPDAPMFTTVVSDGVSIGAFAGDIVDIPTAWQSADGGATWRSATLGGTECRPEDAIEFGGRFIAVGSGRREGVDEIAACVMSATLPPAEWDSQLLLDLGWRWIREVVVTPAGLLAVGARLKPDSTQVRSASVLFSPDGEEWSEIAQLPELREDFGFIQAAAAGPKGIVVFGAVSRESGVGETPSPDSNLRVWFAPND